MTDPMQQARELLPCPFCGGDAERIDFGPGDTENDGGSCIACKRCQASGPVEFGFKENFIANWNRRTALRAAPEGYVLVPVEPTEEMLAACEHQWCVGSASDMARREWAAMLTTRPKA